METGIKEKIQKPELEMLVDMDRVCRENDLSYSLAYGTVLGAVRHKGFIPWDTDIDIMVDIDHYRHFCDTLQKKLPEKYFIYSYQNCSEYEYLFARIGLKDVRHTSLHIDIFPMVGLPGSRSGRKLYARLAYLIFRCYFFKQINPRVNYEKEPFKRRVGLISKVVLLPFPSKLFVKIYETMQKLYPVCQSRYLYNFCGLYRYKEIISSEYLNQLTYLEFEGHCFPVPQEWDRYLIHIYGDYMTPKRTNYV